MASTAAAQEPEPIRDNSLLIEEAYNQEPGVVQHVLLYGRDRASGDWELGFTQEWPAWSQDHQVSYTVPWAGVGGNRGWGDVGLNYRYRWLAGERSESVVRLSVLLPTGSSRRGLGAGGLGLAANLPFSHQHNRALASHWNVGGSIVPSARASDGSRTSAREMFAGASVVWLTHPLFNVLAEALWTRAETAEPAGMRSVESSLVVVPGVRGAINLRSGPQIVPGAGLVVELNGGARVSGFLLYLSFEHAFQ